MTANADWPALGETIQRALRLTRAMQDQPKQDPVERGAWRYWNVIADDHNSDLSITSWQLMFYRSAKTAGFEVASERIDRAMKFVVACFDRTEGCFLYAPNFDQRTRAMNGAGIFTLANAGMHDTAMARQAGDWQLRQPYTHYHSGNSGRDRRNFHYGVFYTTIAMYQLGGDYWRQHFPQLVDTLIRHQHPDGHWDTELGEMGRFGRVYTTALTVTALNTPNQLRPIFQR